MVFFCKMNKKYTNRDVISHLVGPSSEPPVLTVRVIAEALRKIPSEAASKAAERAINQSVLRCSAIDASSLVDEHERPAKRLVLEQLLTSARRKRKLVLFAQIIMPDCNGQFLVLNDARGGRRWVRLGLDSDSRDPLLVALNKVCDFEKKDIIVIPSGQVVQLFRRLVKENRSQRVVELCVGSITVSLEAYSHGSLDILQNVNPRRGVNVRGVVTHLERLEAESIHIFREVMADAESPVMLFSLGKDSSVMLHLARKAFHPCPLPFPLLHIDTGWKFQAMYDFRDFTASDLNLNLLVHSNSEGLARNINPFDHGAALHTDIMKTQSLKMALEHYKFDVAFGGARRDEEKSRAKERVFSFRTVSHQWDPKNQRPELWNLYNGKKNRDETIRVFPISNWTELDIWQYIYREQIPIVPLYFASERPVIERDGMLMMVDDDRVPLHAGETIQIRKVRFRTLGCYPLTGAIESEADDLGSIILELLSAHTSERQGRTIDRVAGASMEKKKQDGYF